jgi:hypothetical protein
MLQRLINALGDAADRYGEPPDPDPEAQKMNDFVEPTVDQPSLADLMEWDERGGCEATDGCWVEPDGGCEHGHVSWLVYLGLI